MYNTDKWIGRVYGGLIGLNHPFSAVRGRNKIKGDKCQHITCYCKICGSIGDFESNLLIARKTVACCKRCTKIHVYSLPLDYWEDNGIDIDKVVHRMITNTSKNRRHLVDNLKDHHIQKLCDSYEKQEGVCAMLGTKLYKGKNTIDPYKSASLDRLDNIFGYEVEGNHRWIHKKLNDMLNCMTDRQALDVCHLLVVKDEKTSKNPENFPEFS